MVVRSCCSKKKLGIYLEWLFEWRLDFLLDHFLVGPLKSCKQIIHGFSTLMFRCSLKGFLGCVESEYRSIAVMSI